MAGDLSRLITATFRQHPTIPRDLSLLFNILEHNVSDEKLVAFKGQLIERLDTLCDQFTRILGCEEEACWRLQLGLQAVILGAWQLARPTDKGRAIVAAYPALAKLSPNFDETLEWCVTSFLSGFLSEPSIFVTPRVSESRSPNG